MANNLYGPWVGKKTGLEAVRAQNGYYLYLGDKVSIIGDGVGMFWRENGTEILPDTECFSRLMQDLVNDSTTVEIYFPEELMRSDGVLVRSLWSDRNGDLVASKSQRMIGAHDDFFDRGKVDEHLKNTQNHDLVLEDFCIMSMDERHVYNDWIFSSSRYEFVNPKGD